MTTWTARMRALREASGLSRTELSRRAAVAVATVKACELGYRRPSRPMLIALLRALDADPETRSELLQAAGYSREGAAEGDLDVEFTVDASSLAAPLSSSP
jgi:transcriptional regulator with XRE-family HTH domain